MTLQILIFPLQNKHMFGIMKIKAEADNLY